MKTLNDLIEKVLTSNTLLKNKTNQFDAVTVTNGDMYGYSHASDEIVELLNSVKLSSIEYGLVTAVIGNTTLTLDIQRNGSILKVILIETIKTNQPDVINLVKRILTKNNLTGNDLSRSSADITRVVRKDYFTKTGFINQLNDVLNIDRTYYKLTLAFGENFGIVVKRKNRADKRLKMIIRSVITEVIQGE